MSWVATAVAGGAVIGAYGAHSAASTQAKGQEQAAETQKQMFDTVTANERPYMQAGYGATQSLNELMGLSAPTGAGGSASGTGLPGGYLTQTFNPTQEQLNNYPGYQFALQTGGQATRNADTPGVGSLSGAALKDLMNFNVGTASQHYGEYFNQFQAQQNNIFSRLSSIASLGQNAAGNVGNNGATLGTGVAQAQAGAAASQAGGIVGATNSLGSVPLQMLYANKMWGGGGGSGGGFGPNGYQGNTPADFANGTAIGAGS